MLAHTCSLYYEKNPHGADNLVQTALVKLICLNTLLTGDVTMH